MRKKYKCTASDQVARPSLNFADARVSILDGRGKLPLLKRRAHPNELTGRDTAAKNERLGPSADAAIQRAHDDVVCRGRRQRLGSNFAFARSSDPESANSLSHG